MSNEAPTDALRLVPVEPTRGMMDAANRVDWTNEDERATIINIWQAMLAAAPASPLLGGGEMDWQSVAMWMGFSASVIKNGEPWSDQCQQHYDEAKAAFARLAAPTGDA